MCAKADLPNQFCLDQRTGGITIKSDDLMISPVLISDCRTAAWPAGRTSDTCSAGSHPHQARVTTISIIHLLS